MSRTGNFCGSCKKKTSIWSDSYEGIMTIWIKQGETCYLSKYVSFKEIPSFYLSIIYLITEIGDGDVGFFLCLSICLHSHPWSLKNSCIYIVTTPLIKMTSPWEANLAEFKVIHGKVNGCMKNQIAFSKTSLPSTFLLSINLFILVFFFCFSFLSLFFDMKDCFTFNVLSPNSAV